MISQNTIQQIISRLDIIEVLGDYVKLKKRGTNYLGNCPFHNEKTPSFTVSPTKEIYKCFGCGRSGNTISFLMEHEKMTYVEALRLLAKKYNVEIEETNSQPEYKEQQQISESLLIINQFAKEYFQDQIWKTEMGMAVAHAYLKQRGFSDDTIQKFQIGYCPAGRSDFADSAIKSQFNEELLVKSGLVVNREGVLYDNYRDRIIFPIHNPVGKIIGFGARLIKKNDKAPKYINTPENELYVKSKVLYGIYYAKQAIDRNNECLLVEGYTDVVSLHQAGVENVVASGGTSLTPDQLKLIKKYTDNLTIIYDGDGAGINAALRGLNLALEEGLRVQLVLIPDGEDPDSYVGKVGKTAFIDFIKTNKKDFVIFQAEIALKDSENDTNKRSEVVNRIAESISRINKVEDFSRKQDYIRKSAALLKIDENGLNTLVNKFIKERIDKAERKTQAIAPEISEEPETADKEKIIDDSLSLIISNELQERAVIRCLLQFGLRPMQNTEGTIADYIYGNLQNFNFENNLLEKIYTTYRAWYDAGIQPTEKSFLYYGDENMSNMAVSLMHFSHELSGHWAKMEEGKKKISDIDPAIEDVRQSVDFFRLRKLKKMLEENQSDLEKATDPTEQQMFMQLHIQLKKYETEITKNLGTVILI